MNIKEPEQIKYLVVDTYKFFRQLEIYHILA